MAASSSLPSGDEIKDHPYQVSVTPGPKGAYEARLTDSGLYVRVDMPGVPPEGVQLIKYSGTRTVTFSGKAPKFWDGYDSSVRVYGGSVVLDQDPNQVEVELSVKNGCMRLLFPGSNGTLHFSPVSGSVSPTVEFSHINPFLIQGVEGVYETRLLKDEISDCMYIRMDMPGLAENHYFLKPDPEEAERTGVLYGGTGDKEHPLDQGGRGYYSGYTLHCGCCQMSRVQHEIKDGVLRILVRKRKIQELQSAQTGRNLGSNPRGRRR
ncbi:uncharacterized protein LOC141622058 [Silene latifolia]|uniref:uncharacterized protein LOC141622058 n=1 Tax=Silene latifolia TaxID=37657 RepID=UPI003D7711C9